MANAFVKQSRWSAWALTPLVAAMGLWHVMTTSGMWDNTIVPSPRNTMKALWEFRAVLRRDLVVTLSEVVLGFVITVLTAILIAVALHVRRDGRSRGIYVALVVLQSVPLWGIAPVLFYWTGPGALTRVVVIVLVAFFPVLVNTVEGLRQIDPELPDLLTSMGATRRQKVVLLEIPNAMVMVVAGAKVTLTMCLIGAVFAEMLVGDMVGLGYRIKEANAHFRVDLVFASVVVMSAIVMLLYGGLALLARRVQPWTFRNGE
jgi:ABC-type nitrate/sulfonate/bicarbonate transport system permease component